MSFNIKYSCFVFVLILCCAINPFFKTFTGLLSILAILRGNLNQIFIFSSWVNFLMLLNPSIIGNINMYDTFFRLLSTIIGFIVVFLIYKRTHKNFNIVFKINTYFCFSLLLITFLHINDELFFLSFFKLLLFYFGSSFSILLFDLIKNQKVIISWIFALFINSLIYSIIIYFLFPQFGYLFIGESVYLFKGIFVHPNKISIFLLPIFILILFKILNNHKKNNKIDFILFIAILIIFLLSGARGIIVSFLISFLITFMIAVFNKKYRVQLKYLSKNLFSLWPVFTVILLFIFLIGNSPFQFINDFILKGASGGDLYEVFLRSRGWKIMISIESFLDHPWTGIGFGQPTPAIYTKKYAILSTGLEGWQDIERWITRDPIFGLPISAPVEKSFFFSAILEEIGILGSTFFAIFYFKWSKIIILQSHSIFNIFLFFTIFTISIFEFVWFSIGSSFFLWLWLGYVTNNALND